VGATDLSGDRTTTTVKKKTESMSDFISTRVNGGMLANMSGRDVRLVGKVVQQANGSAVVEASDGATVRVMGANEAFATAFVEVIGRVNADQSLQQHAFVNFGNQFGAFLLFDVGDLKRLCFFLFFLFC
jgi:hypothetical protein